MSDETFPVIAYREYICVIRIVFVFDAPIMTATCVLMRSEYVFSNESISKIYDWFKNLVDCHIKKNTVSAGDGVNIISSPLKVSVNYEWILNELQNRVALLPCAVVGALRELDKEQKAN